MRLFIAVEIPEEIKSELYNKTAFLRENFPQVSWVPAGNIHLTLKFLGNTQKIKNNELGIKNHEDVLLKQIINEVEKSITGIKPFTLRFTHLGYFDREQFIIWWGIKQTPKLLKLVKQLDSEMKKLGFASKMRPYFPHVTTGRGKRLEAAVKGKIMEAIKQKKVSLQAAFPVSEIILMESILTAKGPIYKPIDLE